MLLIASISPRNLDRQILAIESWKTLGLPIVSLNSEGEIPTIRDHFPAVTIHPVDRSAAAMLGKPLVLLDSVWEFARTRASDNDTICLLNSDLILRDPDRFHQLANQKFDMIFGSRLDVAQASDATGTIYDPGFDYFLITRSALSALPPSPFCLGAPWWDLWLPMIALHLGQKVYRATQPPFAHVTHDTQWNLNWHAIMGLHVAQFLLEHWRKHPPTGIDTIFPEFFFRRMRVLSDVMGGQTKMSPELSAVLQDELTRAFLHAVLQYIRSNAREV